MKGETRARTGCGRSSFLLVALALFLAPVVARAQEAQPAQAARQVESGAQAGQKHAYPELPNFQQVNARLYRGAQPRKGGLQRLAALGVKTVINLRDDDDRAAEEEREAHALGLRYFNVPVSRAGRPSPKHIDEVMALIDAADNQPVFVHCKRGSDRTGAVVAVYRITHDGWTGERALEEAEAFGLGFWQRGKKDFINDYFRDHAMTPGQSETQLKGKQ
jgi:uncharacterized protein (TIGR01244 family)